MNDTTPPSDMPPGYELCVLPGDEFSALIGPVYMRKTAAGTRYAFRAAGKHGNARTVVHGGMLMSFTDLALGRSVQEAAGQLGVATVSLTCDFVAAVRPGDLVECEATVTRVAKRLIFVTGTLYRGSDVIMTASGLWARIRTTAPPSA